MDVRYFLEQRLSFIRQLYTNSTEPFVERKRMIEANEEPYVPTYSEDAEPAFLIEWLEAEESLQVLGHTSVCMLSASFHLYFKTWERQFKFPVGGKYKSDFKLGWFNGYRACFFGEFNVKFEESQCNLSLLEELVLARNRVQHPESITSKSTHYSEDDLKKLQSPFFINIRDFDLFSKKEAGECAWLMPPAIHVTPAKFFSALSEVSTFVEWLEMSQPRHFQKCR